MDQKLYQAYLDILEEELVPAMGCTEPIAVAYAGAIARQTLGAAPSKVRLVVSGNIIKNVKSVVVPHTGGRRGLRVAVAAGIFYGDASRQLEVLSDATEAQVAALDDLMTGMAVELAESDANDPFDIQVTATGGGDEAYVRIIGHHTNVVQVRRNSQVLVDVPFSDDVAQVPQNRLLLNVEDIVRFADSVAVGDVLPVLSRQVELKMAIAREGLEGGHGARIGSILLESYGGSVHTRAKAWAAAGSDARMSGCEMPVVINSGSGNQGLTACVPVVVYARELGVPDDLMYRALVVSNLVAIHLKTGIGALSAFCGATSAGAGAGAGVCYLLGGRYEEIAHTVVNALAINSGMVCDGAKASCAAKIASAVEAGLLGMQMYRHDSQFYGGDGIVVKGVENTIRAVGTLARDGMRSTDAQIIHLMMENDSTR